MCTRSGIPHWGGRAEKALWCISTKGTSKSNLLVVLYLVSPGWMAGRLRRRTIRILTLQISEPLRHLG